LKWYPGSAVQGSGISPRCPAFCAARAWRRMEPRQPDPARHGRSQNRPR
jgi:hypothetical protein